jgi:hypothetical protein
MAVGAKDIMVEIGAPGVPFCRWPFGNGDHGEQHGGVRRIRPGAETVPPIIDQNVDGIERLDLMPP